MLLKVEVFPAGEPLRHRAVNSNNKKDTIDALMPPRDHHHPLPTIASSQPPLYVCLGTSGKPSSKIEMDSKKKKKKKAAAAAVAAASSPDSHLIESDGEDTAGKDEDDDIADDFVDPDAGRLLTVGRAKVGAAAAAASSATTPPTRPNTVLIPATDKSVSREHCLLRLVASKNSMNEHYKFHPRPMASRNDAEEEACVDENNAGNGLCVVVESMGKLGTYLVVEQEEDDDDTSPSKKANKKNDEDDETDDEEDPSQAISQQQQQTQKSQGSTGSAMLPALSDATKQLVKNPLNTMLVPVQQESMVLKGLASATGRVILQCGKMGSTIVISRVPIHFVQAGARKGKASPTEATPWYSRLYVMGATEGGETVTWTTTDDEDDNKDKDNNKNDIMPTTLVLTEKYNATPKQLAAWSRGGGGNSNNSIPIVTPDYMQALLDRKNATDPLPKFSDYIPQSDGNAFWQQVTANPNLWQGAIFLSIDDGSSSSTSSKKKGTSSSASTSSSADTTEMLLASAGAKIVRLYQMSTEQLQEVASRLETDDEYRQACFGLQSSSSSSSRSGTRRSKSASSQNSSSVVAVAAAKLLSDHNIPLFSMRTLAKLLTQQKRLTTPDDDGRIIGGASDKDDAAAVAADEAEKAPAKDSQQSQEKSKDNDKDTSVQEPPPIDSSGAASSSTKRRRGESSQEGSATSASQEGQESVEQQEGRHKKQRHNSSPVEEEESSNKKEDASPEDGGEEDDKVMPLPHIANKNKRKAEEEASQEEQPSQDKDKSNKKKETSSISSKRQKKSLPRTGERRSLATLSTAGSTKQGWLVTAPHKDSKRQAYRRNKEEIMDEGGYEELVQVAETEIVKGLLRKSGGQEEQRRGPNSRATVTPISGPDYKRFWKNEISGRENTSGGRQAGGGKNNRPPQRRRRRFVMKVAGKNRGDDIMQSEYHVQRQALEEQERRADQLFRDPTAPAPRRRRARA